MKTCCTCKESKTPDHYHKSKRSKDGLANQCKDCSKEYSKQWRKQTGYDGRLVESKKCPTCGIVKPSAEFNNDRSRIDGLASQCKACKAKYKLENREKVLARQREQNRKRAEKEKPEVEGRVCSQCNEYKLASEFWKDKHTSDGLYSCCRSCKKKLESTERRRQNQLECGRKWRHENREYTNSYQRKYQGKKRKTDTAFRLRAIVSTAITNRMKGKRYNNQSDRLTKKILEHLPYSVDQLKAHLESQFEPWMSWDNWGRYDPNRKTWQIDHIIPQSKLPFTDFNDDNFKKLWALKNLRPLEVIANIKKGNKLIDIDNVYNHSQ